MTAINQIAVSEKMPVTENKMHTLTVNDTNIPLKKQTPSRNHKSKMDSLIMVEGFMEVPNFRKYVE